MAGFRKYGLLPAQEPDGKSRHDQMRQWGGLALSFLMDASAAVARGRNSSPSFWNSTYSSSSIQACLFWNVPCKIFAALR